MSKQKQYPQQSSIKQSLNVSQLGEKPENKSWFEKFQISHLASLSSASSKLDVLGQAGYLSLAKKNRQYGADGFFQRSFMEEVCQIEEILKTHLPRFIQYRHNGRMKEFDSFTKIKTKLRSAVNRLSDQERNLEFMGESFTPAEATLANFIGEVVDDLERYRVCDK